MAEKITKGIENLRNILHSMPVHDDVSAAKVEMVNLEQAFEELTEKLSELETDNEELESLKVNLNEEISTLQSEIEDYEKKKEHLHELAAETVIDVMKNKILLQLSQNLNLDQLEEVERMAKKQFFINKTYHD